mmetsp:Transcript_8185/g.34195  ORF Transcript_8185/g.34195 Transcript_8185/m.34195 type:complete len:483 (+) Transcript_8185:1087-2535(+)
MCPRFPARAGPRAVSTVRGACVTTPTTSHPPASSFSKRCASSAGCPHCSTSRHIRSTWWCRKLLNGYRRNRPTHRGSAPEATMGSAAASLRALTSVATRSTTLTRFKPRGGVISPHGVFCADASPARSKNATSLGSARTHAATAEYGATRGSGGASPVSAARKACIACAGPAARLASSTATTTSMTFTKGLAVVPLCAVVGKGKVVPVASTSFAPVAPSTREPYVGAFIALGSAFGSAFSKPFTKSFSMALAVASLSASALGAPRAIPTSTSAAFARRVAVSSDEGADEASETSFASSFANASPSPSASRSWSKSVVSASQPVWSVPCMALMSMPCMGDTPGSSAPTKRSRTSATARFWILRTSSRRYLGLVWKKRVVSGALRATTHPTTLPKYPASIEGNGSSVSMNRTIRPNSSHSSSHSVANTASNSQQKISHARYGYLNSRRASASAGGGSTMKDTSFSTTGLVFKKFTSRLFRDLHS